MLVVVDLVLADQNAAIRQAIEAIAEDQWTPVRYPDAIQDPDTGAWISDAEVAEVQYTAFASTKDRITARLIVRRVKDARYPDALFPIWRYHPFFTNFELPTVEADIVHRRHAIIETVFADLIDGPWPTCQDTSAPTPPGSSAPRSRTTCCAPPAPWQVVHTRSLAGQSPEDGSSASRPDWPDPHDNPSSTCPPDGRGHRPGCDCGTTCSATAHPPPSDPYPTAATGPSIPISGKAGQTSGISTPKAPGTGQPNDLQALRSTSGWSADPGLVLDEGDDASTQPARSCFPPMQ